MSIERVLPQLGKVSRSGNGGWMALCPAHDDRKPSLRIRELDDSRTLLHSFAGCSIHEVMKSAVQVHRGS
jgi:hypothetical protein